MNVGVDFGTTRTIVAVADRGNYPVVAFTDTHGDSHDYVPSVVARVGDELVYGFEALDAAQEGAPLVRSFKRALAEPDATADTPIAIGGHPYRLLDVLTGFLAHVRTALLTASSVAGEPLGPANVAVPAHAHGAQRFLTLEAFRAAGFEVTALINEPSAAGFEYTHRQGRTVTSRRTRVLVYDLGGGTFDASLVSVEGTDHEVLGTHGLNRLGGDDFDLVLAERVLASAGIEEDELTAAEVDLLLDESRSAKERLTPQSRRLVIDLGDQPYVVPVADFYAAAEPLVRRTIEAMAPIVSDLGDPDLDEVAGIYLVGGASGLPLVPRSLRERFGRRVFRSPYPAASTAIGLAIAADRLSGFSLVDRLSRGFGVFREERAGARLVLDQLLAADLPLPASGQTTVTRTYRAAHNVGWFRYVEYGATDGDGQPVGHMSPFAEFGFPFDPALQGRDDLAGVPVERRPDGPQVQETYRFDADGLIEVEIADLDTGFRVTRSLRS